METILLAKIMGPVFLAASIGFLVQPKFYKKAVKDFEQHEGLTYFTGIIIMLLGLLVVLNHNIWELNAKGIITFIGWASLVKGATFLVIPNFLFQLSRPILKCETTMKVAMAVWLLMGGYLAYTGYFA